MLNFIFAEFCELVIELNHCFGPLSNQIAMKRPYPLGFDSLRDDLLI
jgi:hypothetical protein